MITLSYSGFFNVFAINSNKSIAKIYSQSLLNVIPNGVYCAEMDENNQYLIIGSNSIISSKKNSNGLFIWRVLNSEPWLKHVPVLDETIQKNKVLYFNNLFKLIVFLFIYSILRLLNI